MTPTKSKARTIWMTNAPSPRSLADTAERQRRNLPIAAIVLLALAVPAWAGEAPPRAGMERLVAAYPDQLEKIDANTLVWRDGTRMPLDDGKGAKAFDEWLENPDIEDMLGQAYPPGDPAGPPPKDFDPGRARNEAFFSRMYGDCRKGEAEKNLTEVVWLPKKAGQRLKITKINGVSDKLAAVSRELDELPASFDRFLFPSQGTFNCRAIAGTKRLSGHGYAIAIDIATKHAHYWRWSKPTADGGLAFKNEIPMEIVRIFEKHGIASRKAVAPRRTR